MARTDRWQLTLDAARALLGTGAAADRQRAEVMLAACAGQGCATAEDLLAELRRGEVAVRPGGESGADALRAGAERGDAEAQHAYGRLLARGGDGVAPDPVAAAWWCRLAAEQGHAQAQFELAMLYSSGTGMRQDHTTATHWLRRAAANDSEPAMACLEAIEGAPRQRPRHWEAAETDRRLIQEMSGPQGGKDMRFAEYYVDPCIDLLVERQRLARDQAEDIVQEFFIELEEPLCQGAHRGVPWKEVLRQGWDPGRGAFRPYLGRALVNFARDWMRARRQPAAGGGESRVDLEAEAGERSGMWRPLLASFTEAHASQRQPAPRAAEVVRCVLEHGESQADLARRFQVTDRSIRNYCRLGGELLARWLERRLAARGGAALEERRREQLANGLTLMPDWLSHPSLEKRLKALVFIAVIAVDLGEAV